MNVSPSLPLGVYRLAPVPHPVPRGAIVVLPVPVSVRHVWSRWLPMLKPVAAVAGEAVCVRDGTLWIHGQDYGPVLRQTRGYALPHLPEGCTEIDAGEVFLASAAARSLDARYVGPVRIATLTARALPVWTWGQP